MMTLLAIMLNEANYVGRWIAHYHKHRAFFQEAVVVDGGSDDGTIEQLRAGGVRIVETPFRGDFAQQRNVGLVACQTPWVFELDADELLSAPLAAGLHAIARDGDRSRTDCFGIPRLNFIDGFLVAGPGAKGLDYQYRLHRQHCRWQGIVHEEIGNYNARIELGLGDGHFILHDKDRARHEARNLYYRALQP